MRNKIFGSIGAIWGALILLNWFNTPTSNNEAYQSGMNFAVIFGALLLIVGIYTFFKKPKSKD